MQIRLTAGAQKQLRQLPNDVQKKARKQFMYLLEDIRHPSLHAKKYQGQDSLWQARIDQSYRFYFFIIEPNYVVISVINHPK